MSPSRIAAIVIVWLLAAGGWTILGTATALRSSSSSERIGPEIQALWGKPLMQGAPAVTTGDRGSEMALAGTKVRANLALDYRRRGLVWYPTYRCDFAGTWRIRNDGAAPIDARIAFAFPDPEGTYSDFRCELDGKPLSDGVDTTHGIATTATIAPGAEAVLDVAYQVRGVAEWRYAPAAHHGRVHDLDLEITTDFAAVDYPLGSLSPIASEPLGDGLRLRWTTSGLLTRKDIGVIVPERLNPGPVASRIIFFAPVCLVFFFVLLAAIHIVRDLAIHPMHYLFIAAGFFAFHLLLAYLVDVIDIHGAFAIGAIASVTLVTSYLRAALGPRFPWLVAATAQVFFLVLFSYSFFWSGMTGLTVAVGSVATLAVLMRLTAGVDWQRVFAKRGPG